MKTIFLRAFEADDKAAVLRAAINEPEVARGKRRFEVDTASFAAVPRSPFAYWVSEQMRRLFKELPSFEDEGRKAKQGLATADDFRFVRGWWAVLPRQVEERWLPFAKGGKFSPFYSDIYLIVNWESSGEEIKNNLNERGGVRSNVWMLQDTAANFFFRPGLTWPIKNRFSLKPWPLPAGCVFAHVGASAFIEGDSAEELAALHALMSSCAFTALLRIMAGWNFEVGLIQTTPIPRLSQTDQSTLGTLARRAWSLKRGLDARTESSHAFMLPALLQVTGDTLTIRAVAWAEHVHTAETKLSTIQAEIDARCFDLYGIDEADRRAITEGFGSTTAAVGTPETDTEADVESEREADDEEAADSRADTMSLVAELVSWAVGVAFGRFDVRLATGARVLPPEPEPFDPLPVCSPAMLTGDDGLPLGSAPTGYPLSFPENGILVDDPGHPHDLTTTVRAVVDVVFGLRADVIWQEASALLDPKDHDMRTWLSASFFEHHLKHHSKSRRKAPIIWQFGLPSGRYSVWLYAHRLTRDSAFQLQNDVVTPKLVHEERQLTSLVQRAGGSPSATERKEIATQETFVEELRALLDEVKRVAPLWTPMLDDGAVLTMAPLWRLVPQYKPWQKELKGKWDELCAGKYNWAYLAMHLWPERVVPNCAIDRSLAIAHGLEDVFWVKGGDGKWKPRSMPSRSVDERIRERTSPAVKAALTSLLEAPYAMSGNGRGRGRRTGAAAVHGGTR